MDAEQTGQLFHSVDAVSFNQAVIWMTLSHCSRSRQYHFFKAVFFLGQAV
jgi:hypothetical protein